MLWIPSAVILYSFAGSVLMLLALSAASFWMDGNYARMALALGADAAICWAYFHIWHKLKKRGNYQEPRMDF